VARGGKDNGGDFQKQPHQSELHNYCEDQWKKIGDQASQLMPLCAKTWKIPDTAM
jgi:hypothetical protein